MDMTAKKDTGSNKTGLPTIQWISLMATMIASVLGGYYTLDKRVSIIEKEITQNSRQDEELQKTVTAGMQMRIELQGQVKSLTGSIENLKQENKEDHNEIKAALQRISTSGTDKKALANGSDFRP